MLLALFTLLFVSTASAQVHAFLAIPKVSTAVTKDFSDPACPPYTGALSAISVAVNDSVTLVVEIGSALPYDVVFTLASANPAYVAAGNRVQGFLPMVTVPAGSLFSDSFTIYGITVGATTIDATSIIGGFSTPVTAWGITNTTGSLQLLDGNSPSAPCIDPSTGMVSATMVLAGCGTPINGVAADGVNPVLLLAQAGLNGTACFDITSTGPPDQGTVSTTNSPLTPSTGSSSLLYGYSVYTPPDGYGTDGTDDRQVSLQFAFTPAGGTTNTTTISVMTNIVRPPLVLIHGLWADSTGWSDTYLRKGMSTDFYTVYPADYKATNAASFTTNQGKVQGFVAEAIKRIRTKQYAATQADVIAHSMGGILTRLYSGLGTYMRADNLMKGDVHRMITLDTPHIGTNFANLLVDLHAVAATATETTVFNLTKGSVTQGAVCDLAQNSTGLTLLSAPTQLTAQFLTGNAGPAGTATMGAPYWGGATFGGFSSFESALTAKTFPVFGSFIFPQATVNAFRFREQNDAVVPLSSQQGGLGGTINFPDLHMHIPSIPGVTRGITDDTAAATTAFNTLDGPLSGLTSPLPGVGSTGTGVPIAPVPGLGTATDAANYGAQCGAGSAMRNNSIGTPVTQIRRPGAAVTAGTYDARITVTSPTAGTVYSSTDTLSITVSVAPSITVVGYGVNVPGIGRLDGTGLTIGAGGTTFQASVVLNAFSVGPLTILPEVYDNLGNLILGTPITVAEKYTGSTLSSAAMVDHNFLSLTPPATQQLYFMGTYADGSMFDISPAVMGTTWSSSNTSVLTVDSNGLATILTTGIAVVTAKNGAFTDYATFVVESSASPLPPADFTSQVTIQKSGLVLNRNTGFFVQTVTLTNTSGLPLAGPLYLVVSGLPAGVSLIGINGVTANIPPIGSGYFTLPLAGGSLTMSPGQVTPLRFQFLNPNRVPLSYSLRMMRTSVAP